MKQMKKDEAVSPVVGVMLMLVVTIIIAAIVAAFAGGIVGDMDKPTNAIIKLDSYNITDNGKIDEMVFIHKGGEKLDVNKSTLSVTYNYTTNKTLFENIVKLGDNNFLSENHGFLTAGDILNITYPVGEGIPTIGDYEMAPGLTFDWAIIDGSGNVIAKGTESADYIKPE
ncbi:MAG TPA: type IV pilin [Methanocorpusculum sp.]|nr:type IV pilin [Methanocorpusculum sp.]